MCLGLLHLKPNMPSSKEREYEYDLSVLKARGIDVGANDFTALVHFRGSW